MKAWWIVKFWERRVYWTLNHTGPQSFIKFGSHTGKAFLQLLILTVGYLLLYVNLHMQTYFIEKSLYHNQLWKLHKHEINNKKE